MATESAVPSGLDGVVVAQTSVGDVRGDEGYFHYRGHSAAVLARTTSLEAVWHLVQRGHLPDDDELARFRQEVGALRGLPRHLEQALPFLASLGSPMAALRTALSLAGQDGDSWIDLDADARAHQALRLTAIMPTLVAALWRTRRGLPVVAPDRSRGVAEEYLRMISGKVPVAQAVQALERYLLLTIDHGFNASTFAVRVVTSTGADLTAAAVAGIGALSGPLHGGAPSRVIEMLDQIGSVANARPWVEQALASGQRIMGFGHRVYRTEDPRSVVLKEVALSLGGPVVDLAIAVEQTIVELLDRRYPQRNLRTNVEFYAGVVLNQIGVPAELLPPTFAVSRMIGWMAHAVEQIGGNRIIRPASRYVGDLHTAAGSTLHVTT